MPLRPRFFLLLCAALPIGAVSAWADQAGTVMITGMRGLNVVPNARMDETGTARIGVAALDPYVHGYLGFQLADSLYISLRQSAETSALNAEPDRLYPGIDAKIRLAEESRYYPEVSLGLQSLFGHKRMAAEYLAASKRWKDFDFTLGLGWGRMGSAGNLPNPLKPVRHFSRRDIDGEMPSNLSDWFTGQDIGAFGGVEYFTPLEGLSLKFDWNADRYKAEKAAGDFAAPPPWSLGAAYKPFEWLDLGIAAQGADKIMGHISLTTMISKWKAPQSPKNMLRLNPERAGENSPGAMETAAGAEGIVLYDTKTTPAGAETKLKLSSYESAPAQIGRAIVPMANHAGKSAEELSVTPTILGLRGPSVKLLRSDFEKALAQKRGSTEEIWRHAAFDVSTDKNFSKLKRPAEVWYGLRDLNLTLEEQASLSEEDTGLLTRSSFIASARGPNLLGFLDSGYGLRVNLHNNLDKIDEIRPRAGLPVRSDVNDFADKRVAIDHLYAAFTHSFTPELHVSLLGGYLEEMYGGLGGEILYRPFGPRWAVGAEVWEALKRDPSVPLSAGFNGDHLLSGHLKAWYDIPGADLTLNAKIGRYLAEDIGGTLALQKNFTGGAHLEAFITATDSADFDPFGGTTHINHGIRLSLPLGGYKYTPRGASVKLKAEPFGRDAGQALESPLPLYDLTEPFSKAHMIRHWGEVLPDQAENP